MPQWLKYGCLGCLGLIVLGVLLVGGMFGIAWLQVRSEQVERNEISQELPPAPAPPPAPPTLDAGPTPAPPAVAEPGRVVFDMDLANGRVRVRPGEPGEAIRIESEMDTGAYEVTGRYERYGEAGWIYTVRMRSRGMGSAVSGLRVLLGGETARVDVYLPPGVPMAIEGEIMKGESRLELGGLWLTSVDMSLHKGAHSVSVGEPLVAPLERFAIRGAQGALNIDSLGNASPGRVDVQHRMGALNLDLRGPWRQDAEIDATASMGGFLIRVPEGVHLEGLDRLAVGMGEAEVSGLGDRPDPGPDAPTLRFRISASMGGLSVQG